MVDTINIRITYPGFQIIRPQLFNPQFIQRTIDELRCSEDPNKFRPKTYLSTHERGGDEYLPTISLQRRYEDGRINYYLYIQVSLPKLICDHNLYEITETDFERMLPILKNKLSKLGVEVTIPALREAVLLKVHFCVNVPLPPPLTVREAIVDLEKAHVSKSMEENHRDFRNNGEALYFYSGVKEAVFYDKVLDMLKSHAKSLDKDESKTSIEKQIAFELKKEGRQILRFEFRLTNGQTTRSFISKLLHRNYEKPVVLKDIFSRDICHKALLQIWTTILKQPGNQLAFKMSLRDDELLDALLSPYRTKKTRPHDLVKVLYRASLYRSINLSGMNVLKQKLATVFSEKTLKRLDSRIRETSDLLDGAPQRQSIQIIDEAIRAFVPGDTDTFNNSK